ncbi:MAG: 5-demethoxyubiquinol-8 5-hydroxylase UbiM [Wenzhouxiangella sp.]
MKNGQASVDIAIVGAGPAGLCMAAALADFGCSVVLIDPASAEQLAAPAFDGREIALTHASRRRLQALGVWSQIDPDDISPLRDAWVFDRDDPTPLAISHQDGRSEQLGFLVPNHAIRRAAFAACPDTIKAASLFGRRVVQVDQGDSRHRLTLDDGSSLEATLVIAADSRHSATRRAFGIAAHQRDFGRSMLVCRMALERDHQQVAWEWFGADRTLALLPINGGVGSAVITRPHAEIQALAALEESAFNEAVTGLYQQRLGRMTLVSERCVYPLVGVWPDRLVAPGFAAIGDAAVGMHPVTAHGFNLGLAGVEILAESLQRSQNGGPFVARPSALAAYQRRHRRTALPMYLATSAVVGLYTRQGPMSSLLRRAALRGAHRLTPFRRLIASQLTGKSPLG